MKKRSSFHMGGEFNGYGEVRYLKGTRPKVRIPHSQENVRLSPDFGNCLLKMLGSIPVVIFPSNRNPVRMAAVGSQAAVNRVIIKKDEKTGRYFFHLKAKNLQELTNGSYPYTFKTTGREEPVVIFLEDQWVKAGEPAGAKWKYYADGKFVKGDWVKSKGKWYYIGFDGYMVTGWQRIGGDWHYFKSDLVNGIEMAGYLTTEEVGNEPEPGSMYQEDSQGTQREAAERGGRG